MQTGIRNNRTVYISKRDKHVKHLNCSKEFKRLAFYSAFFYMLKLDEAATLSLERNTETAVNAKPSITKVLAAFINGK